MLSSSGDSRRGIVWDAGLWVVGIQDDPKIGPNWTPSPRSISGAFVQNNWIPKDPRRTRQKVPKIGVFYTGVPWNAGLNEILQLDSTGSPYRVWDAGRVLYRGYSQDSPST